MIKLIDDLSLLERLSEKEPYFGCLFAAEAISFFDDKELLSIWVELDEKGRAHSFLKANMDSVALFSPCGLPGAEMIMFAVNLISSGVKYIDCDENCLLVLKNLYDFDIENAVQMFCENRIDMPENGFCVKDCYNFSDAYSVMESEHGKNSAQSAELWKLRMTRGVQKKQTTLFTLYDEIPVSTACIRGRTKDFGVITSVITSPEHRHKGYASYLTALCTNMLIDEQRTPWLVPANPGVQKMYEKLGYKAAKTYYYLYNIKEKEDRK